MVDKPEAGEVLGIPYNFERPSVGRLLSAYWQPGKQMLIRKPFGVGYSLNLANWRSWVVLLVAGVLLYQEGDKGDAAEFDDDGPVEVVIDDD